LTAAVSQARDHPLHRPHLEMSAGQGWDLAVTYGPYVTQNRKKGPHMSTKSGLRSDVTPRIGKTWRKTESEWCAARGPSSLVMIVLIC
jgi:hypothetical protein